MSEKQIKEFSEDPNQTRLMVHPDSVTVTSALPVSVLPKLSVVKKIRRLPGRGLNPLVWAANPLLDLAVPLRYMVLSPDVGILRIQLKNAIKQFENDAKEAKIEPTMIAAARYALCTLIDEMISSTVWGGGGVWSHNSLLVAFHNETSGGEKFFSILQHLAQDAEKNLDVLELLYICLALGLEGRYRVIEGGQAQLALLRDRLQKMITSRRGSFERELSQHWRGSKKRMRLVRRFPLWILIVLVGVSLLILQLWLSVNLNRQSEPVLTRLQSMYVNLVVMPTRALVDAPLAVATPELNKPVHPFTKFLDSDIKNGFLSIKQTGDRSIITLRGDGVFATGSTQVGKDFIPLIERIGDAIKTIPGKVIIVGHTDNVVSKTSNWALSKARAESVRVLLAAHGAEHKEFIVEGVGETEPLVPNDSPANRARNRRVEIIILNRDGT